MNNLITWISAEERLPKYYQPVLVLLEDYGTSCEAVFEPQTKEFTHPYYGQCTLGTFDSVTHWTPMPEKP